MSPIQSVRRFKTNPVEIIIFSMITVVFFNSLYNLIYSPQPFYPAALVPMSANPTSEGRHLASAHTPLTSWDVACDKNGQKETPSNKIRLNGPLCGADPLEGASKLVKANIINTANQYNATVFTDVYSGKFSTDYIPLVQGNNSIRIEFSYFNGKSITQDFVINKI